MMVRRLRPLASIVLLALLFGLAIAMIADRELAAQTAREVSVDVQSIRHVNDRAGLAGALDLLERRGSDRESRIFYAIWDSESGILLSSNLPTDYHSGAVSQYGCERFSSNQDDSFDIFGCYLKIGDEVRIFIGRQIPSVQNNSILLFIICLLIATIFLVRLMVIERRALERLQHRLERAESRLSAFAAGQRELRINDAPESSRNGESDALTRLSAAVDTLLDLFAQRLDSQDVIAEQIAHELRSPVARAAQQLASLPETNIAEVRRLAQNAVSDLLRLIEAVLFITELRNRPLALTAFRLDLCAREVCDLYGAAAEDKGIVFTIRLAQTMVTAEQSLVERLLANLLDNAIKYTPAGGEICISTYLDAGHAVVQVDDSGSGMAGLPDHPGRLMTRGANAHAHPGNGLGLALVMRIMARHGGQFTLNGRPDAMGLSARAAFPVP